MGSLLMGELAQGPAADGAGALLAGNTAFLGAFAVVLTLFLLLCFEATEMAAVHHASRGRTQKAQRWKARERPIGLAIPGLVALDLLLVVQRVLSVL